jgi:NAD(P)-dependent dehydrogenase (short-subunit alcohol dehydrogenase family)
MNRENLETSNSLGRLAGKCALITGAATGIGEAIAHKFAREGARVFLAGLETDPVFAVVKAIQAWGGEAAGFQGDLSIESTARLCVEDAMRAFGRIDVLVNNAGVFLFSGETQDYPEDLFKETVLNKIQTTFLITKYSLPHLKASRGTVLSAGSESGQIGLAMNTVYGGTKGWIHAFTRGLAVEQAKYGIRANCVCPGPIDTAWTHKETGPMGRKEEKMLLAATPMGRRGTPEEIANVYAFLASDEASYVTGALWNVDGGTTVAKGSVGKDVPLGLRREPEGSLDLEHSREGLRNKDFRNS